MESKFGIESIHFVAGENGKSNPVSIPLSPITIIVGPNNSGKSVCLNEIQKTCKGIKVNKKIIEKIDFKWPKQVDEIWDSLKPFLVPLNDGSEIESYNIKPQQIMDHEAHLEGSRLFHKPQLQKYLTDKNNTHLIKIITNPLTIKLDRKSRFNILEGQPQTTSSSSPKNYLDVLFHDRIKRVKIQEITFQEFGQYLVIDHISQNNNYILKMSKMRPNPQTEENSSKEGENFFKTCEKLSDFGDGVQSYIGLMAPIMSTPHKIILVDEPDQYLHPPKARELGRTLANLIQSRDGMVIIATHSADIVMGLLQESSDVTIIRLTYKEKQATTCHLKASEVQNLINTPLMRSTGAINAMFHESVIITESTADKIFFEEINRRLLIEDRTISEVKKHRGIKDLLVLNALGKDSIDDLVHHLNKIRVPTFAVLDFDGINGSAFKKLLTAYGIKDPEKSRLCNHRNSVRANIFELAPDPSKKDNFLKDFGISKLKGTEKEDAEQFLTKMRGLGLFFIPNGEVESFIPEAKIPKKDTTSDWIKALFKRVEEYDDLLRPGKGDVWDFMGEISRHRRKHVV